ncbi:hypothetical protein Tco_0442608 [Tanacetum coccineum]
MNEMSNKSKTDSEISLSVFDVRSSDEENTLANDSFSKVDGFHAVPPPIIGNFLTPRADISFAGLDEYAIRKKIIESKTTDLNTKTSETVGQSRDLFTGSCSDRSLSGNEDGMTLQSVYNLCVSLCKQVTTQSVQIKDLKSQIKQLKKKAKPVISHHNAWIKSVSMKKRLARKKSLKKKLMQKESVSKQGRKPTKSEPTVHKDPTFDDFDDIVNDAIDYMETEDAQDEGRTSSKTLELSLSRDTVVLEEKESAEKGVSTEDPVSTAQPKVSTDKPKVSTDKDDEGTTADKILAEKLQEEEREKSLPLRKELSFFMIPLLYKEDLLLNKDMRLSENKFLQEIQLRNQMMDILKHVKRENEIFIPIGSAEDDKLIEKMNKKAAGMDKEEVAKELESSKIVPKEERLFKKFYAPMVSVSLNWNDKFYDYGHFGRELIYYRVFRADGSSRTIFMSKEVMNSRRNARRVKLQSRIFYENCGVHVLRLEDGTEINMLAERRYPLTKHTLERMMDLRLTTVSDDDTVFDLLRFIVQQIDEFEGQDGSEKDL